MKKNPAPDVSSCSPHELEVHPDLVNFPGLSDDQLAALTLSVKERGIQEPLTIDVHGRVYDGRARLQIAKALELFTVPFVTRDETDVLAYAIESAVNRRQLTRSAVAFLLFEQHPDLATVNGRKGGRPSTYKKTGPEGPVLNSYTALGARYRIKKEYFLLLAEMFNEASEDEWSELRHAILFEEASIPRQYAGFKTGLKPGNKRGAVIYASVNEQGLLDGILPRAFSSIREGFSRWNTHEINSKAKAAIEKEWAELLDEAPPELLRIAKRKAAQNG